MTDKIVVKNKVLECKICGKWWQTHENNQYLDRCPECGSINKNHFDVAGYGNRLYTSHIMSHSVYNEIIFGSKNGRTWHNQFGEIKGDWVEKNHNKIKKLNKQKPNN